MPFPTQQILPQQVQNHIGLAEMLTKIAGFSGSAIAVIKVSVTFLNDRSFKRKISKTASEIDGLLTQLRQLKEEPWMQHGGSLDAYQAHLEEDLEDKLERLHELKVEKLLRATRRNAEPRGIRRWLLLYRPEGFDGFSMQSWFYFLLMFNLFLLVVPLINTAYSFVLILALPWIGMAFYVRSIALRLKGVGNAVRLRCVTPPNSDLGGFRQTLVLWLHGQWFSRTIFYVLFLLAVWLQIYAARYLHKNGAEARGVWGFMLVLTLILLAAGEIFRADALSRRAKGRLAGATVAEAVTVAEAAPTV
jgi:hypothetical protein